MRNLLLAGLLAASSAFAAPIFTVIPALGPDNLTSANFNTWAANVINGMRFGLPQGSGVSQYLPLANGANLTGGEFLDSSPAGFNSWQGVTPGLFAGETGTVLYFGVKIVDSGGQGTFSLSQVMADETYLGTAFGASSIAGSGYRATALGITQGDAMLFSGESANTLVKELYYVGAGFTQPVDTSIVGTNQQILDGTKALVQALADRTTQVCYSIDGAGQGCGSVNVEGSAQTGVPEPGTVALLGLGLAGVAFLRRRSA